MILTITSEANGFLIPCCVFTILFFEGPGSKKIFFSFSFKKNQITHATQNQIKKILQKLDFQATLKKESLTGYEPFYKFNMKRIQEN